MDEITIRKANRSSIFPIHDARHLDPFAFWQQQDVAEPVIPMDTRRDHVLAEQSAVQGFGKPAEGKVRAVQWLDLTQLSYRYIDPLPHDRVVDSSYGVSRAVQLGYGGGRSVQFGRSHLVHPDAGQFRFEQHSSAVHCAALEHAGQESQQLTGDHTLTEFGDGVGVPIQPA